MYCPDCGNECGNSRFCRACGRELAQAEDSHIALELLGTYQGLDGCIEVDFCSVTVRKDTPSGLITATFLCEDISYIEFSQASGEQLGYLAFRDEKHDSPITSELDAAGDDLAILFDEGVNDSFVELFRYFSQLVHKRAHDNKGQKRRKPVYIRDRRTCPRCSSTRSITYGTRQGNHHYQVFECMKCRLKWEW